MSAEHALTRRDFTLESALAILSAATITITGCGDDDPDGLAPVPGQGEVGTISANHGHTVSTHVRANHGRRALTVSPSRAGHTHPHFISHRGADAAIGQNQQVSVISSTDDGHNHTVRSTDPPRGRLTAAPTHPARVGRLSVSATGFASQSGTRDPAGGGRFFEVG